MQKMRASFLPHPVHLSRLRQQNCERVWAVHALTCEATISRPHTTMAL